MTRIVERKVKPDGTVREYACRAVYRGRRFAVIAFELPEGGGGFQVPIELSPGSVSYGFFWEGRSYSAYRFVAPGGAVLAHRFDAVADVAVSPDAIDYRDLVLDWWAFPDGRLEEEDRDELEDLARSGELAPGDVAKAEAAARMIYGRYRHIIDEIDRLARRHGAIPG